MLLFLKLLIAHAVADFALQSPDMARLKNRHNKPTNVSSGQKIVSCWFYFLTAHALMHGGGVWLVTGNPIFGIAEIGLHWIIDFAKCENFTDPHIDQMLHVACKLFYVFLILYC